MSPGEQKGQYVTQTICAEQEFIVPANFDDDLFLSAFCQIYGVSARYFLIGELICSQLCPIYF